MPMGDLVVIGEIICDDGVGCSRGEWFEDAWEERGRNAEPDPDVERRVWLWRFMRAR